MSNNSGMQNIELHVNDSQDSIRPQTQILTNAHLEITTLIDRQKGVLSPQNAPATSKILLDSKVRVMNSAQPQIEQPNDIYNNMNTHTIDLSSAASHRLDMIKRRDSANNDYISYDQISEEKSDNEDVSRQPWKLADLDSVQNSVNEETDTNDKNNNIVDEAMPFAKKTFDLKMDVKLGWKPMDIEQSGAPIPLLYNFNPSSYKAYDPDTGEEIEPLYMGPRYPTSIQMHKMYSNKDKTTGSDQGYPSYKFDFPLVEKKFKEKQPISTIGKQNEKPRNFVGMNPRLVNERELRFDSMFESGNLDLVLSTKPWEYDCYMRVDTNTRGHHQWFYFSVSYDLPQHFHERKLKFNILNFTKPQSLYQNGMRICVAKKSSGYQWQRAGENIRYGQSKAIS